MLEIFHNKINKQKLTEDYWNPTQIGTSWFLIPKGDALDQYRMKDIKHLNEWEHEVKP